MVFATTQNMPRYDYDLLRFRSLQYKLLLFYKKRLHFYQLTNATKKPVSQLGHPEQKYTLVFC